MATKLEGVRMNVKKLLILLTLILIVMFLSGCNTNTTDNKDDGYNDFDIENWLDTYSPVHSVGNESINFWINYPIDNPNSSQPVIHLPFVNDSLKEGCVLFVVHKTGCVACQPQADRVISLANKYGEKVKFHDLDITLGGSVEQRAYDAYLYDPDGPPGYIALTGVFTLINNNGKIEYAWHSWEFDVDSSELETWIRDAIYYYHVNSER